MKLKEISIAVIVFLGLLFHTQGLAVVLVEPCEKVVLDQYFDRLRHFALDDAVPKFLYELLDWVKNGLKS